MIRRLKAQVLTDLPPKTRTPLWVNLPERLLAGYRRAEEDLAGYLLGTAKRKAIREAVRLFRVGVEQGIPPAKAAVDAVAAVNSPEVAFSDKVGGQRLMALWRLVGEAKVPFAIQWVLDQLETEPDKPLVSFVHNQNVLKGLAAGMQKAGKRWTYADGGVSAKERHVRELAFQAGEYDLFIGTTAVHAGITLTRASTTLFVERWWNPAKEEQAEDRIHRIGQTDATEIVYLMALGTVDERINKINAAKRLEVAAVMGSEETAEGAVDEEAAERLAGGSVAAAVAASLASSVEARIGAGSGVRTRIGMGGGEDGPGSPVLVSLSDLRDALRG